MPLPVPLLEPLLEAAEVEDDPPPLEVPLAWEPPEEEPDPPLVWETMKAAPSSVSPLLQRRTKKSARLKESANTSRLNN